MYKVYIASNRYTKAFDSKIVNTENENVAVGVGKRMAGNDAKDLCIWENKIIDGIEVT